MRKLVKICPFLGEPCIKEKCLGYDTFPLSRFYVYDKVDKEGYHIVKECQVIEHCCAFGNNKEIEREVVVFEYPQAFYLKGGNLSLMSLSDFKEQTKDMKVRVMKVKR